MRWHSVAVIPARFGSSRLPGKPLLPVLGGEPMIAHVARAALAARSVHRVIVATDHAEIAAAAERAGAEAVMTDSALPSGTDRVAAALSAAGASADVIVNVQGDEPLIRPEAIDLAARLLLGRPAADIATLSAPLPAAALLDPDQVKVVCAPEPADEAAAAAVGGRSGRALFFSRAPIGVDRSALRALLSEGLADGRRGAPPAADFGCRLHVGLYAYRPAALRRFVALPPSPLEALEGLEQMRALEAGMRIVVGEVDEAARGVDTLDDLRELEVLWQRRQRES